MPVLEILALKGLAVIAKAGVAKMLGVMTIKSAVAYGVGTAVGTAAVVCVVAGGLKLTEEAVKNLQSLFGALERGNTSEAAREAIGLIAKIKSAGTTDHWFMETVNQCIATDFEDERLVKKLLREGQQIIKEGSRSLDELDRM